MKRRLCLASIATVVSACSAPVGSRGQVKPQQFASLGIGPFEFPISGTFVVSNDKVPTILETQDESRRYYLGSFNNVFASRTAEPDVLVERLEKVTKTSWEKFVQKQNGVVRVPFGRRSTGSLTVFFMGSEFTEKGQLEYYVQYGVTNGRRLATIFAEGPGPAQQVHDELFPKILLAKAAHGA